MKQLIYKADFITCEGLVSNQYRPVTSIVRGELLNGKAYARECPAMLEIQELGPNSRAYHAELFEQLSCRAIPIFLFEFSNAIVFGQGSVIVGNKHLLRDTVAEYINQNLAPDGAREDGEALELVHAHRQRFLSGTSILIKRPWYRNFGHWLVDLMPLLPLAREAAVHVDRIIFGLVPNGLLKTLMEKTARTYYPRAEIVFVDDEEHIRCESLLYVQPVHIPPLFKHPLAVEITVAAAKEMYRAKEERVYPNRIYVSRQKLAARTVVNDSALVERLERSGFVTVHPEEHDFSEQIAMFEAADFVVGVKGAAFANAVFCKPGAHVLLLSPPDFIDPFFWDLLSPRGIKYSEIFCKAAGSASISASHIDFEVSLGSVNLFLHRIDD